MWSAAANGIEKKIVREIDRERKHVRQRVRVYVCTRYNLSNCQAKSVYFKKHITRQM